MPVSFQQMMDQTLRGLNYFVGVYLDDIVIHSLTWKEHLVHLQQVLERLQDAGLTLKKSVNSEQHITLNLDIALVKEVSDLKE